MVLERGDVLLPEHNNYALFLAYMYLVEAYGRPKKPRIAHFVRRVRGSMLPI